MLPRESVGIILQRRIFRETDLIVTFYGELEGRLSGLAFGALRSRVRFQNCLDLFSKSLVRYTVRPGRELVRLESCDLIDAHLGLRNEERTLAYAAYLGDLVLHLSATEDASPGVFELLDKALGWLEGGMRGDQVARIFEIRLLTLLGYRLELKNCVRCGRAPAPSDPMFFTVSGGGVVCPDCVVRDRRTLSRGTLRVLIHAQEHPLQSMGQLRFSSRNRGESKGLLRAFLVRLLERQLRTMTYLDRLEKERTP